jgi:Meiotically Up-regulated Gene 113 (MUG113) protein
MCTDTNDCYVYVLLDTAGKYKIGHTKNIERRRKQLQTGNSGELKICYSRCFSNCRKAEDTIHNIFAAQRKRGEWFSLAGADRRLLDKIFTLKDLSDSDRSSLKRLGLL